MAHVLPRFYRHTERAEREARICQIVLESGGEAPKRVAGARAVDTQSLRGIPVVGPAVGGCAPGTDPVHALMRKQPRE